MSSLSFHEAVEAAFDAVAVGVDDFGEKAINKPGVEGLHVFLEGCRESAPRCGVSEDAVSVNSVSKVFHEYSWPLDFSFKRHDLATLFESLGISESSEEELSRDLALLANHLDGRAAAKEFPLLRPVELRVEEEQSAAA